MFRHFTARKQNRKIVDSLYGEIVENARSPALYLDMGMADTVMGRFEALALYVYLFLARCRDDPALKPLAQDLVDHFMTDLDAAIRELGVGDISVPKKMRRLAGMFYERAAAYDTAIGSGKDGALAAALADHALGDDVAPDAAKRLADHVMKTKLRYEAASVENILRGRLSA